MRVAPTDDQTPISDSILGRAYLGAIESSAEATVDATSERLLDAAYELFCRTGIQRTPMEKVAQRAGVTRVTLYRKFETKDALVEQVVLREFRRYFGKFRADIREADSAADRVVLGFVGSLRAIAGNPLISGLFDAEPALLINSMIGDGGQLVATVRAFVADQLRRERAAGNVDTRLDVDLVAEMMVRITASFLTVPSRIVDLTDDDKLASLARQFLVPMLTPPDD